METPLPQYDLKAGRGDIASRAQEELVWKGDPYGQRCGHGQDCSRVRSVLPQLLLSA